MSHNFATPPTVAGVFNLSLWNVPVETAFGLQMVSDNRCLMIGDSTSQPPHQHPTLSEELSGKQQQCHLQIKKTQGAWCRLGATLHRGTYQRDIQLQLSVVRHMLSCSNLLTITKKHCRTFYMLSFLCVCTFFCAVRVEPTRAWFFRPGKTAAGRAGEPCVATLGPRGGATSIWWSDNLEDLSSLHWLLFPQ